MYSNFVCQCVCHYDRITIYIIIHTNQFYTKNYHIFISKILFNFRNGNQLNCCIIKLNIYKKNSEHKVSTKIYKKFLNFDF